MKHTILFLLSIFLLAGCGGEQKSDKAENNGETIAADAKVMVYYFHGKQRCPSCVAIQNVTEQTVKEQFAENKDVRYAEIDFSVKANEELADKYEVAWSSLIIASADKHINLTDEGFAHAMRSPETLKELIVESVNNLLNN